MNRRNWLGLVAVLLAATARSSELAGEGGTTGEAWELMRVLQFNEARDLFRAAPITPESSFGEAIALLNVQPRTAANITRAREILQGLAEGDVSAPLTQAARLFVARIDLMHRTPPNESQAIQRLLSLHDDAPDSVWGQLAVALAAPSMLYASADPGERARALADLEARAQRIHRDWIARPLRLALARACIDFGEPPSRALGHLLAAEVERLHLPQIRADAYVQIGELARAVGSNDVARLYFSRLYREFPRDYRRYMVGEILQELGEAP